MKIKTLLESQKSLEVFTNKKLPLALSFEIGKMTKQINEEISLFNEARNKKIVELGEKQKDGSFKLKQENIQKFNKEFEALLNKDIKINIPSVKISDLIKIKDFETIESYILSDLDWLVKK